MLKPFSFERFSKAVNKAKERFFDKRSPVVSSKISVKSDKGIYQIGVDDILFVEACGDYVILQLPDKKLVVHGTLKSWEEKLKGHMFQKVHRTNLINLHKISHVEGNYVHIGGHKVPLSDSFKADLLGQMLKF